MCDRAVVGYFGCLKGRGDLVAWVHQSFVLEVVGRVVESVRKAGVVEVDRCQRVGPRLCRECGLLPRAIQWAAAWAPLLLGLRVERPPSSAFPLATTNLRCYVASQESLQCRNYQKTVKTIDKQVYLVQCKNAANIQCAWPPVVHNRGEPDARQRPTMPGLKMQGRK